MEIRVSKLYKSPLRQIYAAAFSAIEFTLISLILFSALPKTELCYSAIVVAFLFAIPFLNADLKDNAFILAALFFTLIADFFLVIEYELTHGYAFQCLGVSAFFVVQFFYFLYLEKTGRKENFLRNVLIRLALSLVFAAVSVVVLKEKTNYLSIVSVVYYTWLLINLVMAFSHGKKTLVLAVGLVFFALCDLWVGLQNANGVFFTIPESGFIHSIVFPPFNAVWLCYGLSQTFIVLHMILKSIRSK